MNIPHLMKTNPSQSPKSTFLIALGKTLKKIRHDQKMSQAEFARISGIHRTYVSAIEKGEKNITLISMLKIAKALKMSAGEILDISLE
jgi:transcriptional regulator with XRE-family HTH domain